MNYDSLLNRTALRIPPSGIRRFFDIAAEMEDVISLSVGEPDFPTPWHVRDVAIDSLQKGRTGYSPNRGFTALCREICGYYSRRFGLDYDFRSEIVVTVGGSEAIDLAIRTLVNPGDEVLVPQPSFVCYDPIARLAGARTVPLVTRREDEFRLTGQRHGGNGGRPEVADHHHIDHAGQRSEGQLDERRPGKLNDVLIHGAAVDAFGKYGFCFFARMFFNKFVRAPFEVVKHGSADVGFLGFDLLLCHRKLPPQYILFD